MPSVSPAQHRLMEGVAHNPEFAKKVGIPQHVGKEFANADDCKAAGTIYLAGDEILLMRRSQGANDAAGLWSLPAGHREEGETALDAANRESAEETGFFPGPGSKQFSRTTDFVTFVHYLKDKFEPIRNEEHDDHKWFPLSDLPTPMHPGLKASLGKDMSESDWAGFAQGFKEWAAAEDSAEEDPKQADKFIWSEGDIKIVHEGTEEAPEPEDEIEEIDEADVVPTAELDITA